jgi:hypothetical protein
VTAAHHSYAIKIRFRLVQIKKVDSKETMPSLMGSTQALRPVKPGGGPGRRNQNWRRLKLGWRQNSNLPNSPPAGPCARSCSPDAVVGRWDVGFPRKEVSFGAYVLYFPGIIWRGCGHNANGEPFVLSSVIANEVTSERACRRSIRPRSDLMHVLHQAWGHRETEH